MACPQNSSTLKEHLVPMIGRRYQALHFYPETRIDHINHENFILIPNFNNNTPDHYIPAH